MSDQAVVVERADLEQTGDVSRNRQSLTNNSLSIVLDRLGYALIMALPVLFVVGRAPADIAISLIALLFLVRSQLGLGWRWMRTAWVSAALLFWGYLLLASALAIDPENSFGRALPFIRFILLAAALQHWLLIDRRRIYQFLSVLAAVLVFVLVDCLYQYVQGEDLFGKVAEGAFRLSGPFNNDVVGTFIAKTSLPLLGWWFAWSVARGHLSWLVGGLLAASIGLVILLTGERMALGTYGLGVIVLILYIRQVRLPLMLIGLIAAIGLGTAILSNQTLHQRFVGHTANDVDDFWSGRYGVIFVRAFDVWRDNPVTGVGLKNFRQTCDVPNFDHKGPVDTWCFTHPHNPYMELLAETGIVGLLLFFLMIGLVLRNLSAGWRKERPDFPLAVGSSAALILFLWPLLISKSIFSNWNAMLLWLMIGLALSITSVASGDMRNVASSDD
ncbi:MAG: O-antigen ligase family protein [Geminicoccales bacterium]